MSLTIIILILFTFLFCLRNFFQLFRFKPKSVADFLMTEEEIAKYEKIEKEFLAQERKISDIQDYHERLKNIGANTRKNKDGTYDRRSKYGDLLNLELPKLPKKVEKELKIGKSLTGKLETYRKLYDSRKNKWTNNLAGNYAFVFYLIASLPTIITAIVFDNQIGKILIWVPIIFYFLIKGIYKKEIGKLLSEHEKYYNIKAFLP